jgi:hypothetical protein
MSFMATKPHVRAALRLLGLSVCVRTMSCLRHSLNLFHIPSTSVLGYLYSARVAGWISADSFHSIFRNESMGPLATKLQTTHSPASNSHRGGFLISAFPKKRRIFLRQIGD